MSVPPEVPYFEIFFKPVTISINLFTSWRLTTATNKVTLFMKLNLIRVPDIMVSNVGHGQAHLTFTGRDNMVLIIWTIFGLCLTSAH